MTLKQDVAAAVFDAVRKGVAECVMLSRVLDVVEAHECARDEEANGKIATLQFALDSMRAGRDSAAASRNDEIARRQQCEEEIAKLKAQLDEAVKGRDAALATNSLLRDQRNQLEKDWNAALRDRDERGAEAKRLRNMIVNYCQRNVPSDAIDAEAARPDSPTKEW